MPKSLARFSLLLIVVISLGAAWSASKIGFDYDFEKFFPLGDNDLFYFLEYREQFENDNDFLLVGFQPKKGIFDQDFLVRLDSLTEHLKSLPMVNEVYSPTNATRLIRSPLGWTPIRYLHLDQPARLQQDSLTIYSREDLKGRLFSNDGKAICLVIKHRQRIKRAAADSLMAGLNQRVTTLNLPRPHLAGKVRAQPVYLELIQEEMIAFLTASLLLVVIFLAVIYRTTWAVVIPMLVVALSGLWILGFMNLVGKPLDLMMVLLPTIIFVVGMSDVVHILTRYIEELRLGHSRMASLTTTFKEVGIATFLTSLTTGIGFLTLMTNNIEPIRDFGLYTAIGVFIAYILAFTLLPSALIFLPKPRIAVNQTARRRWKVILTNTLNWTFNHQYHIICGTLLLIVLAWIGIRNLEVNTYLIDDLPRSHPMKSDFLFFDEQFGGSRPFEMSISLKKPDLTVFDYPVLKEMDKVDAYLMQSYGTSALTSPLSIVKGLNEAVNGGSRDFYGLPDSSEMASFTKYLKQIKRQTSFQSIVREDQRYARFTGRMGDIGSSLTTYHNQQLKEFFKHSVDTNLVNFRVTGTSLLIDKNNAYLVNNMMYGLSIAFMVVALIAGGLFRSWRMVFITLIPNIIPLVLVAGIMGALGITLKLTTSVIFTVAFGIAVDDTIHFISKLKMELAKGKSVLYAIKRTYFSTGKAIVITTLILISGFMTLLLSSFGGTFYIGLFVGLTLLLALIIDLTLLPVLILLFYRPAR